MSKLTKIRVYSTADYNLTCDACGKTQRENQSHTCFVFDDVASGTKGAGAIHHIMCSPCVVKAIGEKVVTLMLGDVDLVEDGDPGFLVTGDDGSISLANRLGDAVEVRW